MIRTVQTSLSGCVVAFNHLQRYRDRLQPFAVDYLTNLFVAFRPTTGKRIVSPAGDDFFLAVPDQIEVNPRVATMTFTNKNAGLEAMHMGHYVADVYGCNVAIRSDDNVTGQGVAVVRVSNSTIVWEPGMAEPTADVVKWLSVYSHHFTEQQDPVFEEGRAMSPTSDNVVAIINPKNFDGIN